jgi:hypothetical protein
MRFLIVASLFALTGCAASVTFVDRTNGEEYIGKTGGTSRAEGQLSGTAAFGTATGVAVSAHGNGLINMRDMAGSYIRCVFSFNGLSNTGIGECQRNDGRQYDLRIKR